MSDNLKTTTYQLTSTKLVRTPGVLAWAINGYAFKEDRPQLLKVFTEGYGVPEAHAHKLLSKEVPYTIEGESVVFTISEAITS